MLHHEKAMKSPVSTSWLKHIENVYIHVTSPHNCLCQSQVASAAAVADRACSLASALAAGTGVSHGSMGLGLA